jgi:hypothetical protein
LNGVVHVNEIAALAPVAIDVERLAPQGAVGGNADDPGIRRIWPLSDAIHIEEAQAERRYAARLACRPNLEENPPFDRANSRLSLRQTEDVR